MIVIVEIFFINVILFLVRSFYLSNYLTIIFVLSDNSLLRRLIMMQDPYIAIN